MKNKSMKMLQQNKTLSIFAGKKNDKPHTQITENASLSTSARREHISVD